MRFVLALCLGLGLVPGIAAGAAMGCGAPQALPDGWQVAAPEQEGLDPALICAIGPRLEGWKRAIPHGVVVVRHGTLVYEHYFTGDDERRGKPVGPVTYRVDTKHDLRSITKSIVSLLVGIAIDRGWLADLDVPVFSYFPAHADLRTPEKDRITLHHLLTMSPGLTWNEVVPYSDPKSSERRMNAAADPYRYVLEQPVQEQPGTRFNYNGGGTLLLAAILHRVSGRPLDVLAREVLFDPLGIADVEWHRYGNGDVMAASGLRLRPRDLAKIGQLLLARGSWHGRQIVSAAWIDQSLSARIAGEGMPFNGYEGMSAYGYQWWIGRSSVGKREVGWAAGVGWGGPAAICGARPRPGRRRHGWRLPATGIAGSCRRHDAEPVRAAGGKLG